VIDKTEAGFKHLKFLMIHVYDSLIGEATMLGRL
jgi:hypothetical protein